MEFKIGERVFCKSLNNRGVIIDKLSSATRQDYMVYILQVDGIQQPVQTVGDDLEGIAYTEKTFSFDINLLDGVVVVIMYEEYEDGRRVELCRGHGHQIHRNAVGLAQAASYALKRLYTSMNGGNICLNNKEDNYE